jgi:hypothetical protein
MDFGLARAFGAAAGKRLESAPDRTGAPNETWARAGTPRYMAPEQRTGSAGDTRSDVYAFGLIAHELIRGKLPNGPRLALDLPYWLRRCLQPAPARRYENGAALLAAMERPTVPPALVLALCATLLGLERIAAIWFPLQLRQYPAGLMILISAFSLMGIGVRTERGLNNAGAGLSGIMFGCSMLMDNPALSLAFAVFGLVVLLARVFGVLPSHIAPRPTFASRRASQTDATASKY